MGWPGPVKVVIEKGVVAEHQVARIVIYGFQVFALGEGKPALPQAEVAYPAGIFAVVHGTAADLRVDRGIFAVIERQERVALAAKITVLVKLEIQAGASPVHKRRNTGLAHAVQKAAAPGKATVKSHVQRVEVAEFAGIPGGTGNTPAACGVVTAPKVVVHFFVQAGVALPVFSANFELFP